MKAMKYTLTALALLATQTASAAVNLHTFTPSANPAYIYSEDALQSSVWGSKGQRRVFFGAFYDMINEPLVELNADHTVRRKTLVQNMNSLSLSFGYGLLDNLQLGASTAMSMVSFPDGHSEFGITDSRLFGKVRLNSENAAVTVALMPELYVPTGRRDLFLSNGTVGGGARLIAEHDFRFMQVVANAGYRYHPEATFRDLDMKSSVPLSLGVLVPVSSKWALNGDISGDIAVPFNSYQNPSAIYLGGRYRLPSDFTLSLGGAVGSVNGYSSADYRVLIGVTLMPQGKTIVVEQKPVPAPVVVATVAPAPKPAPVVVAKPRVTFTPKEILITEEVKFEHAKARLTPSGMNLLDEVAKVLKDNRRSYKSIIIEGHTNDLGTHKFNDKLSRERAASVKEYLISRGVHTSTLQTIGYGKRRPKVTHGLSKEARLAANRRVEFKVIQDKNMKKQQQLATKPDAQKPEAAIAAPEKIQDASLGGP